MTITQALEQRNIKCKELNNYEWELTYNNNKYMLRTSAISQMFYLYDLTNSKSITTRASFRTICRLILLGHK